MNLLIYILFVGVFLTQWLVGSLDLGPKILAWSPEIVSAFAVIVVALRVGTDRSIVVPQKYIVLFSIMIVLVLVGIVANTVQSGAVFAGLRKYFRYAPIFLLPIVYSFADAQIKNQLRFFLILALLQVPVAIYQRMTIFQTANTGDVITGTVGGSGILSVFLVCAIAMLTAFLVKRRIGLKFYVPTVAILFIPTAINETVATLLLLPLAFVLPVLLAPRERSRLRMLIPVAGIGVLILAVFVSVYNAEFRRFGGQDGGLETALIEGRIFKSLYRGATAESRVGEEGKSMHDISRLDSIAMPFLIISDPVKLIIGNGIGNVSASFTRHFEGDYSEEAYLYGADYTTLANLLWEIGIIGVALSFLVVLLVFNDARALAVRQDMSGVVALGWAAIVPVLAAAMFYLDLVDKTVLGYMMWYLSGYVVGKRYQQYEQTSREMPAIAARDWTKSRSSLYTPKPANIR
jgi:hypothetical protein